MTAKQPSQKTAKAARSIAPPQYDSREDAPTSIADALILDIRDASRPAMRCIAHDLELTCDNAKTLDQWVRRRKGQWNDTEIKAIVCRTGGRHTRAFLDTLALDCSSMSGDPVSLIQFAAGQVSASSAMLQRIADDVAANDDTPGEIDPREAAMIDRLIHEQIASLTDLRARINGGAA